VLAAAAISSDDELDGTELLLSVIADLEAPHVRMLERLEAILLKRTHAVPESFLQRPDNGAILDSSAPDVINNGISLNGLRAHGTAKGGAVDAILAVLERNGLVRRAEA